MKFQYSLFTILAHILCETRSILFITTTMAAIFLIFLLVLLFHNYMQST